MVRNESRRTWGIKALNAECVEMHMVEIPLVEVE